MLRKIISPMVFIWCVNADAITITSSEYGEPWPFTVESGDLKCVSDVAVVFTANENEYAVNGAALAMKYKPIEEIWRQDPESLMNAEAIAREENKSVGEIQAEMGILRVDIRPVLERGLALCKSANR